MLHVASQQDRTAVVRVIAKTLDHFPVNKTDKVSARRTQLERDRNRNRNRNRSRIRNQQSEAEPESEYSNLNLNHYTLYSGTVR